MTKAKFTLTVTVEWDINPEWYTPDIPLSGTDDERIQYDIKNIGNDFSIIIDHDNALFDLQGVLIEEASHE